LSALRQGYVDALLVGGVEEYTPHRAWSTELVGDGPAGEAAVVFVVERDAGRQRGSRAADLLAVATGFCASDASGGPSAALAGCVRRALARAGADPCQVRTAATGDAPDERVEADAVTAALGRRPRMLNVKAALGECHAASGGLALAMALAAHRQDAALAGGLTVITGRSRDGGVAAAVVRGCGGAGVDRE
jgi:3-oxoacyl-[acyl-carrier-protein] synthase II